MGFIKGKMNQELGGKETENWTVLKHIAQKANVASLIVRPQAFYWDCEVSELIKLLCVNITVAAVFFWPSDYH